MRCGVCKKSGDTITIDHVRTCTGVVYVQRADLPRDRKEAPQWPASPKQIDYVLGLQVERNLPSWWAERTRDDLAKMNRDEVSDDINQLKTFTKNAKSPDVYKPTMPASRYALLVKGRVSDEPTWRFFQVEDGKGRWAGYKFLKRLIGSPGDYQKAPVSPSERDGIFRLIEADPKEAMVNFGKQTRHCGRCLSPLTHERSRAAGYGEKCASALGWPW